jgi:transitional endoplasmic reticulum ATPase
VATTSEKRSLQRMKEQLAELTEEKNKREALEKETPRDRKSRETRESQVAAIMDGLEVLGGKVFNDEDILYEGDKLIIPENMSLTQAKNFLQQKEADLETETQFRKTFNYRPWDGAWCMWQALKKQFGVVGHGAKISFGLFGPMSEPPEMITVNSGVGQTEQVPWGEFTIPALPETTFETGAFTHPEYGMLFSLTVTGPKKWRFRIEGIFNLIEKELETNSLYRGKAFDGQEMPEFVDVFSVDRDKVVYSEEVLTQLEANVWMQLRYTEACEKLGIPLKRAVLIHGPYGVGKTLAAMLTGQEAVTAGWTFIKARPGRDNLVSVLQTARLYQPAVVFYEDLDAIATVEDPNGQKYDRASISRLLDDFDGVDAKGTKILCVLTTNFPERIHKGMARPGRLDAMIEINELDEQGVEKLVRVRIPEEALE